jgi:hypothetical protein
MQHGETRIHATERWTSMFEAFSDLQITLAMHTIVSDRYLT